MKVEFGEVEVCSVEFCILYIYVAGETTLSVLKLRLLIENTKICLNVLCENFI